MHLSWRAGLQLAAAGSAITLITMIGSAPVSAAPGGRPGPAGLLPAIRGIHNAANDKGGGEGDEIMAQAEQYAAVRTAPGTKVSPAAFAAATAAARKLAHSGGRWQEVTNQPYNSDALGYRDPIWSNSSGGARLVTGRMTALAVDGRALFAGAANGGVWRSTDGGAHWKPVFTQQNNLSIGAIAVNPADGSVWVGTGEANTSQDSYAGNGIYRSADNGRTWHLVGTSLPNRLVYQITFDGAGGVYAATSYGLIKRSALDLTSSWKTLLKPDPNPHELSVSHLFRYRREGAAGHRRERRHRGAGLARRHAADRHPVQRLLRVGQRRQDVQQGRADRRAEGRHRPRPDDVRLLRRRHAAICGGRVHRHGRVQGRVRVAERQPGRAVEAPREHPDADQLRLRAGDVPGDARCA